MSLKKYIEDSGIDQIEDDQEFVEAEYNTIQTYCENCGYFITDDDLKIIKSRGLEESFIRWKQTYIEDHYHIETRDGLIMYIIRNSDENNIATLDMFSTEIMGYSPYENIMETITASFKEDELEVLKYFFGSILKEV